MKLKYSEIVLMYIVHIWTLV